MKRRALLRTIGVLILAVLVTTIAAPAEAGQRGGRHRHCVTFAADGVGQDLGGGQTRATILVGGRQIGTTTASFTIGTVTGTSAAFTGPLVFSPAHRAGTLTAQLVGTFDVVSGVFAARSVTVTGTRSLRKVSGTLEVQGTEDLTTGTFTETLSGTLCIAKKHRSTLAHLVAGR